MSKGTRSVAGLHESEDFDTRTLPGWLKKETKEVIEVAVTFGWRVHLSSGGSVTILAPGDRKKYHFSPSGRASNSLPRIRRDIFRFGDPEKVLLADSVAGISDPREQAVVAQTLMNSGVIPLVGNEGTIEDDSEAVAVALEDEEQKRKAAEGVRRMAEAAATRLTSSNEPRIVSTKPMLAKSSDGEAYESKAALERKWSDGSVDYKCVECEFTSPNRLSVRGHFQKHRKGKGPAPERFKAEVPLAAIYNPRQSRIDALAEYLDQHLTEGGQQDLKTLAREALIWVRTQTKQGTAHSEEYDTEGPEDILQRIKNLLDDGSMAATRQRIDELEESLITEQLAREEAERRADAARSNLRALLDMARDAAGEDDEEARAV